MEEKKKEGGKRRKRAQIKEGKGVKNGGTVGTVEKKKAQRPGEKDIGR